MFQRLAPVLGLIVLSLNAWGTDDPLKSFYTFEHPDCKVKVLPLPKNHDYLKDVLSEKLLEKNFSFTFIQEDQALREKDLYLTISVVHPQGKAYRDCIVKAQIKEAASNYRTTKKDKIIFEKEVKRMYPRITIKGNERCRRALKDTFAEFAYCKKIK